MKALECYKSIYKSVNGEGIELTDLQIRSADKFIGLIEDEYGSSIGEHFWFDYICFQFENYIRSDQNRRKISPNWVFGDKAWRRWVTKDKEFWAHWVTIFRGRFNIRGNIFELNSVSEDLIELEKDRERKRFYGTDQGFLYCFENKLFNIKCKNCILCVNYRFCK